MADSLEDIIFDVRARTVEFQRDLDKARRKTHASTKSMASEFGRVTKSIFSLRSALMVTASAAALGAIVKNSLEAVDALAKTSDKLGVTTEALISLRYAAKQTGVEQNTLDMALQRMTRRLSEAAQGSGEAKNAIKELGLDAKRLASLSPDRAFEEIAQAMQQVDNQSDRVRLAFKFFDSEGVALVNTLRLGRDGLREMRDEAKRLGLTIDRETARKAEEANDKFATLSMVLKTRLMVAITELAPEIDKLAQSLIKVLPPLTEFMGSIATLMTEGIGYDTQTNIQTLEEQIKTARGEADQLRFAIAEWESVNPKYYALDNLREKLRQVENNIKRLQKFQVHTTAGVAPWQKKAPPQPPSMSASGSSSSASEKQQVGSMAIYGPGLWEIAAQERWEVHSRGLDMLIQVEEEKGQDFLNQFSDTASQMNIFWDEAMRNMQDASADFFFDALQGNINSFESFVDSMKVALDRMVANYLAAQTTMKAQDLFGQLATWGAGLFAGGGFSNALGGGGAAGAKMLSTGAIINPSGSVFRMHSGMTVPGTPGEERLAILKAGETVSPQGVQNGGGGVSIGKIVIQANDANSFNSPRAQMQTMAGLAKAINRANQRGN